MLIQACTNEDHFKRD